jgi:dihydroorotase
VTAIANIRGALARMERIGMPLLVHGEVTDPKIDIFDREAVFIDRRLGPLTEKFPGLKMILEHLTTSVAVDFVRAKFPQVAGTITAHHLELTRTDMLGHGMRPDLYCMPIAKTERDRRTIVAAAVSGEPCYFLGSDSAPHPLARKRSIPAAAGIFTAPTAIEIYADVFDREGALDKLEAFASLNGPRHYGMAPNEGTIALERADWTPPATLAVNGPEECIPVYRGGQSLRWRLAA